MSSPMETRALVALYRNHPSTPPADRYSWRAKPQARARRRMLLDWAAELRDDELLSCRNLGVAALAWIRAQPAVDVARHVHEGEWCGACVAHGRELGLREGSGSQHDDSHPMTTVQREGVWYDFCYTCQRETGLMVREGSGSGD